MSEIGLYESATGEVVLEVRADQDTVWLSRQQMATLFGRDVKTVGKHIANAKREELEGVPTVANFATVQTKRLLTLALLRSEGPSTFRWEQTECRRTVRYVSRTQ